jgi:hypothetical protein
MRSIYTQLSKVYPDQVASQMVNELEEKIFGTLLDINLNRIKGEVWEDLLIEIYTPLVRKTSRRSGT